jgi:hypothetical protein
VRSWANINTASFNLYPLAEISFQQIRLALSVSHHKNHHLPSSASIRRWWNGWAANWLVLWLMVGRILAQKLGKQHKHHIVSFNLHPCQNLIPARLAWAVSRRHENRHLPSSASIRRWWNGWAAKWLVLWLMVGRTGSEVGKTELYFFACTLAKILFQQDWHMGCFTPWEPSLTIICIYQEMMEWMSSKLIGVVADDL